MFWNNFSALCLRNNESPNGVAKKLSISSGTVTFWKKGKVPHHVTLLKIADYFGVTVDDLLREDEPTTTEDDVSGIKKQLFRQIDKLDIDALAELESYVNYLADKKQKNK